MSNFTAFDQMGMLAADAAAALGSGQPMKSNDTVNKGAKDVPWIEVLNFDVNRKHRQGGGSASLSSIRPS